MRPHRLRLKHRRHRLRILLLTPWLLGWLITSLRLHSSLGHGVSVLAVTVFAALFATALLAWRRAFSGKSSG